MRIRAAYRLYNGSQRAITPSKDDVAADLCWVELDGHRFNQVVKLETTMEHAAQTITVTFLGTLEMVALGYDDEALPDSWLGRRLYARRYRKDQRARRALLNEIRKGEQP